MAEHVGTLNLEDLYRYRPIRANFEIVMNSINPGSTGRQEEAQIVEKMFEIEHELAKAYLGSEYDAANSYMFDPIGGAIFEATIED